MIGCVFYALAASGERQSWATPNDAAAADQQGAPKRETTQENLDITLDTVVSSNSEADEASVAK